MVAAELFKKLIAQIAPSLKEHGFVKNSNRFYLKGENNCGLIDFQKSTKSTPSEVVFTINVGVRSDALVDFFDPDALDKRPTIEDCHWRSRIGFLLPGKCDKWWVIDSFDSLENLKYELALCVTDIAIPALDLHISDKYLCKEWLAGKSPGLTNIQRLIYLSVLLKKSGNRDDYEGVVREMMRESEGGASESRVKVHLRQLELVDFG